MIIEKHQFPKFLGVISMIILLFLSLIFFVERTTFLDNPFQLFLMLQDQRIDVMAGRYPSVIMRWLPFLTMKLGGGITSMMMAFSLSYMLFHGLIFYAVAFLLRRPRLALIIPGMLTIGVTDGFYWCNSELIQGASMVVLALAFYISHKTYLIKVIGAALCILLSLFFHPLTIVLIIFIFLFELNIKRIDKTLLALIGLAIFFYVAKSIWFPNWYDTMKSESFVANANQYLLQPWNIPSLKGFAQQLFGGYWMILLLLTASTILMVRARNWLTLLITLSAFVGYTILVHISDPTAPYAFYIEVNYTPLVVISLWPLIRKEVRLKSNWPLLLITILLLIGIARISIRSDHYRSRYEWYEQTLSKAPFDRYYASQERIPMKIIQMPWPSPYESLIITTREGKSKTLYIAPPPEGLIKQQPASFIGTFKQYDVLNEKYFNLSKDEYRELPQDLLKKIN